MVTLLGGFCQGRLGAGGYIQITDQQWSKRSLKPSSFNYLNPIMKSKFLFTAATALCIANANAATTTEMICSFAPSQNETVRQIGTAVGGAAAGSQLILYTTGLTIVAHSSGASILTGAAGYVAGTMAGAAVGAVMIPAAVVVGGTAIGVELLCAPTNNPELSSEVKKIAQEYKKKSGNAIDTISEKITQVKNIAEDKFYELMGEPWYHRVYRKTIRAVTT